MSVPPLPIQEELEKTSVDVKAFLEEKVWPNDNRPAVLLSVPTVHLQGRGN